jgi:hypothetical protein
VFNPLRLRCNICQEEFMMIRSQAFQRSRRRCAPMGDAPNGAGMSFPTTPVAQQPRGRSDSWFEAMAQAWADVMDEQAQTVVRLSDEFSANRNDPGSAIQLQAQAQKLSFLATASSTSINSVGNALEVLAKKQ